MALFYSPSAPGFFDDAIHATLPSDAIAITSARHAELLAAQAAGADIVTGPNGRPHIRRHTPSIADRRAAMTAMVKREAARRINVISPIWRQLNDMRDPGPDAAARFAAIDAVRATSQAVEAQIAAATLAQLAALDIANHPAWPPSNEDADA